jgi:hypothetical protein
MPMLMRRDLLGTARAGVAIARAGLGWPGNFQAEAAGVRRCRRAYRQGSAHRRARRNVANVVFAMFLP